MLEDKMVGMVVVPLVQVAAQRTFLLLEEELLMFELAELRSQIERRSVAGAGVQVEKTVRHRPAVAVGILAV
jgi:hypothetical protein